MAPATTSFPRREVIDAATGEIYSNSHCGEKWAMVLAGRQGMRLANSPEDAIAYLERVHRTADPKGENQRLAEVVQKEKDYIRRDFDSVWFCVRDAA